MQVVDASISESMFNMLEGCIPELVHHGHDRPPSGSTISGEGASSTFTSESAEPSRSCGLLQQHFSVIHSSVVLLQAMSAAMVG